MNGLSRDINGLAVRGLRTLSKSVRKVPSTEFTIFDFTTTVQNANGTFNKCDPFKSYFNPKFDIILFREHPCIWSIVRLLQDMRNAHVDVQRIAVVRSGQVFNCHDWKHDDLIHGHVDQDMVYGYAIAGGCNVVQALPGMHEDVAWTNIAAGIPALKEVSFVVPSHLLQDIAGKIDTSITFRPARGDGLTKGQVRVKYNFQREVDQITVGGIPDRCSMDGTMNSWVGDKKPSFRVVSLAQKSSTQGMAFESMIVTDNDLPKLNGSNLQFIRSLE
ncbi:uncharacterized protein RAG0_02629 [Rhynchosporium agropyri]|uniref:Uncharacterized protein n=1 Tax=Rhynchosporium agropyri TaxID=914238 RepID=A0A1E1K6D2_9HELO|nr:uncharacterized protein RAG0_02629 [Rhynchosporium agropyri]